MKPHEVEAVRRGQYGKLSGLVERLVATIDSLSGSGNVASAGAGDVYQINPVEVRWLEYPDLAPVRRTANDWLRTAVLALGEYEIQRLEDELRAKGKWQLWNDAQ